MTNKTPEWVPELLQRFGTNLLGEPNYRIVWSEDRLEWRDGMWSRKYGDGLDRWVLEQWVGPSFYGNPAEWEAVKTEDGTSVLGPFPYRGDYEHSLTFACNNDFIPLSYSLIELTCQVIEKGKLKSNVDRRIAIEEAKAKHKKAQDLLFENLWHNAAPAVHAKIPDHIQRMDSMGVISAEEAKNKLGLKRGASQVSGKRLAQRLMKNRKVNNASNS
jgi:hypothetical protein